MLFRSVIDRVQYQSRPDRFEYQLTSKGRGLVAVVAVLDELSEHWRNDTSAA